VTAWNLDRARYADKMRHLGRPLMVTQEEFAVAVRVLAKARRCGMSDHMIADQVGVHYTLASKVRRGVVKTMHRDSFEGVMRLRPERPGTYRSDTRGKVHSGAYGSPVGTVRRIQALRADGFPGNFLGDQLGVSYEAVAQLARRPRESVLETTRADVAKLYEELAGKRPEDFGISGHSISKCSTMARRAGYAPRSCWDDDTIDDPDAFPDWTGRCGTPFGMVVHRREDIPVCGPCGEAFTGELYPGFQPHLLRRLREKAGLSRTALGAMVWGVNESTIQYWEDGRSAPTRQFKLDRVLEALDATYEDVCEEPS